MTKFFTNLRKNEDGATAIEYGLIAALIAIALITALSTLGDSLTSVFGNVQTELDNSISSDSSSSSSEEAAN